MRIAVSGTHCSGKSTLIEYFLAAHPDYVHEPEPYEWLDEMSAEPTIDDFHRQLELSVERLSQYAPGTNVIAERSPLDFVAYLLALSDLGRTAADPTRIASATERAAIGMAHLDLLVLLPLTEEILAPEDEDLELREAMNDRLLDLVGGAGPLVIEIQGTRSQRLRQLVEKVREFG